MLFQKKIDRAFQKLHEQSDHPEVDHFQPQKQEGNRTDEERPELEKNDFLAMVLSAILVLVPAALLVLGGLGFLGYFFLMR